MNTQPTKRFLKNISRLDSLVQNDKIYAEHSLKKLKSDPFHAGDPRSEIHSESIEHTPIIIIGIDEVGRGPLAGPVAAAAVALNYEGIAKDDPELWSLLDDSKRVTPQNRALLSDFIKKKAAGWALGWVDHAEIDKINILRASQKAMRLAAHNLLLKLSTGKNYTALALVDGYHFSIPNCETHAIIKGDTKSAAIAAASIIAKVARDKYMESIDKTYPGYGLSSHKGYPTKAHLQAIKEYGILPIHRQSFGPVKKEIERKARSTE